MTTKDFLYLGLIAVAALVFYCHGFFSGVYRARKTYEELLGAPREADPANNDASSDLDDNQARERSRQSDWTFPYPNSRSRLSGQDLQGDFGNN